MRSRHFACGGLALLLAAALAAPAPADEDPRVRRAPDAELAWGACPRLFPPGCEIAVLHGDPGLPNSDVFLRVPGGYALPHHWHSSALRMLLVEGELELAFDDRPAAVLRPGTYAWGPPFAPHAGRCVGPAPCVLFIAFEGPIDTFANVPAQP